MFSTMHLELCLKNDWLPSVTGRLYVTYNQLLGKHVLCAYIKFLVCHKTKMKIRRVNLYYKVRW